MVALLVFTGDSCWPKKHCWTQKVHLTVTFSKIRLDMSHDTTDARYKTFIQCNCISYS